MERAQKPTTARGDNLDRLLSLLEAARAEEAARRPVNVWTAWRELLAAIEAEPAPRASQPVAA